MFSSIPGALSQPQLLFGSNKDTNEDEPPRFRKEIIDNKEYTVERLDPIEGRGFFANITGLDGIPERREGLYRLGREKRAYQSTNPEKLKKDPRLDQNA